MFGSIDVVLVSENAVVICQLSFPQLTSVWWGLCGVPDAHSWSWDSGELDGAGETLVTLRVIILKTDLKFNGLEEVSLFFIQGIIKKLLHVLAHSGCGVMLADDILS